MSAAAVSLAELVWRSSRPEDMHRVATAALPKEFGLPEFEDHAWTGTALGGRRA